MQLLIVLALVFASFVALFALQNAQTVPIRIFAWERETSVAVIVLATAAVGALSAVLAGFVRQVRSGIRFRQLRSELAKTQRLLEEERDRALDLQAELDALQAKPVEAVLGALEAPVARDPGSGPEPHDDEVGAHIDPSDDEAGADASGAPVHKES